MRPLIRPLCSPELRHLLLQITQNKQRKETIHQINPHISIQRIGAHPLWPQISPEHNSSNNQPCKSKEYVPCDKDEVDHEEWLGAAGEEEAEDREEDEGEVGVAWDGEPGGEGEGDFGVEDGEVGAGEVFVGEVEVADDKGDHGEEDQVGVVGGWFHAIWIIWIWLLGWVNLI